MMPPIRWLRERHNAQNVAQWVAEIRFALGSSNPDVVSTGSAALDLLWQYVNALESQFEDDAYDTPD